MKQQSLLREWKSFADSKIMVEYKENQSGVKDCYLVGIMVQAETRNLNERVYPLEEIKRAVNALREQIQADESILCECDHPDTLSINLDRVAGMLVDIWMDGNNGVGKIKLLPTTLGKELRAMIESGVKLGVSSRGSGDVDHRGIVHDYEIVTVDIVAKPSAPDAYPTAVFESLYSKGGYHLNEDSTSTNKATQTGKNIDSEIVTFFNELRNENK